LESLAHKMDYFESDKTAFVVKAAIQERLPDIQRLADCIQHYQLAARSMDELAVLWAKQTLDTAITSNWKVFGHCWVECLEAIRTFSNNVREREYARRVGEEVGWQVRTKLQARTILNAVQNKYKGPYRNPQRRWIDSVLTEKKVPKSEVLYKYYKLMVLNSKNIPNEVACIIVQF
jgi:hypothetical protein